MIQCQILFFKFCLPLLELPGFCRFSEFQNVGLSPLGSLATDSRKKREQMWQTGFRRLEENGQNLWETDSMRQLSWKGGQLIWSSSDGREDVQMEEQGRECTWWIYADLIVDKGTLMTHSFKYQRKQKGGGLYAESYKVFSELLWKVILQIRPVFWA